MVHDYPAMTVSVSVCQTGEGTGVCMCLFSCISGAHVSDRNRNTVLAAVDG